MRLSEKFGKHVLLSVRLWPQEIAQESKARQQAGTWCSAVCKCSLSSRHTLDVFALYWYQVCRRGRCAGPRSHLVVPFHVFKGLVMFPPYTPWIECAVRAIVLAQTDFRSYSLLFSPCELISAVRGVFSWVRRFLVLCYPQYILGNFEERGVGDTCFRSAL